ncbi:MAG: serine protease [Chloroflexi bacterium]|nr:serine protease [Chloroflexota bacterium]
MAQDELRRAIELMQDGRVEEAAGRLRGLADEPALDAKGRAAAFVWLAEAHKDIELKRRCLERALELDPANGQIKQGLEQLLARPAQPEHLPLMRGRADRPIKLEQAPPVVGVRGGRNGLASGLFVSGDGLLATTSYAVGSAVEVRVQLGNDREVMAPVLRRHPGFDLAFLAAGVELARKPSVAPPAMMAENAAFVALSYGGARLRGMLVANSSGAREPWLNTNIAPVQLPDAGGNPLLDERGHTLGIMTRNLGRGGHACALKMSHVLALAEQLRRERQLMPDAGYCASCGALARALLFGGRTCETCGARLTASPSRKAQSDELMQLYGENAGPPCRRCGARLGQYGGRCLRCGYGVALTGAG